MAVKVFVPGRPGSGKSVAIRCMAELAGDRGLSTTHVKDYTILQKMFVQDRDKEHRQFRQTDYGGFDVCDFSVLDAAIEQLDEDIQKLEDAHDNSVIFIEFARENYKASFDLFKKTPLNTAYFLFVESDLEDCIERIYKRVCERQQPDHHFVSEYIMRTYYDKDNWTYMKTNFARDFGIQEQHIATVYNNGSFEEFLRNMKSSADALFHTALNVQEELISIR